MKKIISVVGARPQFIKLSALSSKLRTAFKEVIVHTGQHYDSNMSNVFFDELEISKPDYNLGVGSGYHGAQTGEMMIKLEEVILKEEPNLIVIFGDTNSTLAGALVASKLHIPSVHVEAGLRSFNREMPEEINRVVADQVSDYLFVPNQEALDNLAVEGLEEKAILTGDIMVDSVIENANRAIEKSKVMLKNNLKSNEYYLATLHRPYNVDEAENLHLIFEELSRLEKEVMFPIHPRTRKFLEKNKIRVRDNIKLIPPVGYLDFLCLQQNSFKVITDSGGVQKEAYILKKPCITLRSETEWTETVKSGWNLLIDIRKNPGFSGLIKGFNTPEKHEDLFGSNVGDRMLKEIEKILH